MCSTSLTVSVSKVSIGTFYVYAGSSLFPVSNSSCSTYATAPWFEPQVLVNYQKLNFYLGTLLTTLLSVGLLTWVDCVLHLLLLDPHTQIWTYHIQKSWFVLPTVRSFFGSWSELFLTLVCYPILAALNAMALFRLYKCSMVMPYRPTPHLEKRWLVTNPMALVAHVKLLMVMQYRPTTPLEKSGCKIRYKWSEAWHEQLKS